MTQEEFETENNRQFSLVTRQLINANRKLMKDAKIPEKTELELMTEIIWELGFVKEDIQVDRYSKDKNIVDIEKIQEKLNELFDMLKEAKNE